jgi:phosphotransferase system  glucose/maltose/N-acetylglucosamine-specific IIC component
MKKIKGGIMVSCALLFLVSIGWALETGDGLAFLSAMVFGYSVSEMVKAGWWKELRQIVSKEDLGVKIK